MATSEDIVIQTAAIEFAKGTTRIKCCIKGYNSDHVYVVIGDSAYVLSHDQYYKIYRVEFVPKYTEIKLYDSECKTN